MCLGVVYFYLHNVIIMLLILINKYFSNYGIQSLIIMNDMSMEKKDKKNSTYDFLCLPSLVDIETF